MSQWALKALSSTTESTVFKVFTKLQSHLKVDEDIGNLAMRRKFKILSTDAFSTATLLTDAMFNHKLLVPCTMNGLEYSKYK